MSNSCEIVSIGLFRGSLGPSHSVPHPFLVPTYLCSILNITLKSNGNEFGVVFLVMWGGSFVVTINTKLLGGKISFFQCVCVLGYCVFPIVLGAVLVAILRIFQADFLILKLVLAIICLVWSSMSKSFVYLRLSIFYERDHRPQEKFHRHIPDLPFLLVHRLVPHLHLIVTLSFTEHIL